jgi:Ca-activated chloride channel family protein
MSNSKSILQIKRKSYRWYGVGFIMICLLFFFYKNIFNIKVFTVSSLAVFKANTEYQKAQWGDAEIQYKKALEIMPNSNSALYNLGNTYYRQGRYSEALVIYLKLSNDKTNKNCSATWMSLGDTYYKLGTLEKSYESFKKALLLDNSNVIVQQNFLYVAQLLQKENQKRSPSKIQKGTAKDSPQKKEEESDNKDGEKDNKKMQQGSYHFSDKEMNDMLQQAKNKVRVPQGTKSRTNQSKTNQLDY